MKFLIREDVEFVLQEEVSEKGSNSVLDAENIKHAWCGFRRYMSDRKIDS